MSCRNVNFQSDSHPEKLSFSVICRRMAAYRNIADEICQQAK